MRRLFAFPLLILLALIGATPAFADPTVLTPTGPASVTAGQSFVVNVGVSQPATVNPHTLAGAPLHLESTGGFVITDVSGAGVTAPASPAYPTTDWLGTLDLAAGDTTQVAVTLRAPAAPQSSAVPLSVSVDGQEDDDGDAGTDPPTVRAIAGSVAAVSTALQVLTDVTPVFPTKTTTATVNVSNNGDTAWTDPVVVELVLPAGLSIAGTAAPGLSGTTWTVPDPGPNTTATLTLTVTVASGASGPLTLKATEPSSVDASSPVAVAPTPTLTVQAPAGPLEEDGAAGLAIVTITNSATISTGQFTVDVALGTDLQLVSTNPGVGNAYDTATDTWSVTVAPGTSASLGLQIKAVAATNHANLTITPRSYGIFAANLNVAVNSKTPVADPVITFGGLSTPVFPTETKTITVFLTNAGDATSQPNPVAITLGPKLSIVGAPAGYSGGVWNAPALAPSGQAQIEFTVRVAADAAAGNQGLTAAPVGGPSKTFSVAVAPLPQVSFSQIASLVEDGAPRTLAVTVTNVATIPTDPLSLLPDLSSGLALDSSDPELTSGSLAIGSLAPSSTTTLFLTIGATTSAQGTVGVKLAPTADLSALAYGISRKTKSISVTAKVIVPSPELTYVPPAVKLFPGDESTVTAKVTNTSNSTWPNGFQVTFTQPPGLSISSTSPALSGLQWVRVGAVEPNGVVTIPLKIKAATGASAGPRTITGSPSGGAAKALEVEVQPAPQVTITPPAASLAEGGAAGTAVVTVTNGASIATAPLTLRVTVPSGLGLVRATPALSGDMWNVSELAPGAAAVLLLDLRGTAAGSHPLTVQLGRYGAADVPQSITVGPRVIEEPAPPVVETPPVVTPPVVTPPAQTPQPPVTVVPDDVLSIELGEPNRKGLAYTYRGEVRYRGQPLTKEACKRTDVQLVVWKMNGKRKAKKASARVDVGLVYLSGHCLFGTRYSFFKRYKGKHYRIDFRATVKVALPVVSGTSRIPAPTTVIDPITVGRG